jgi:hypothetical protein
MAGCLPRRVPCQALGKERFERKSCWDSALRCGKKLLVKQLRSSGAVRKLRRATPFSQLHCRAPGRRDAGSFQVTERVSSHGARFMSPSAFHVTQGFATRLPSMGLSAEPCDGACWHNHLAASLFHRLNSHSQGNLRSRSSPPRGLAASWLGGELGLAAEPERNYIAKLSRRPNVCHPGEGGVT